MGPGRRALLALAVLGGLALGGGLAACDESGPGGAGGAGDPLTLIGRDFEDPAVSDLARRLCNGFPNDNAGNIKCLGQGFELNLLSDLSVGSVTLYNQENGGFNQYRGPMPYGLTWQDTYPSVLDRLGTPDAQYGGNGVDVYVVYEQLGTYRIEVHFDAFHNNPEDLANARVHMVYVHL